VFALNDYNYDLPENLIAQHPHAERDGSRLLCLKRYSGEITHHRFSEVLGLLDPGDVIVVNNTEVVPGRLMGKKESGGKAELLILNYADGLKTLKESGVFECRCLVRASKRPKIGSSIIFQKGVKANITEFNDGVYRAAFSSGKDFIQNLFEIGKVPLPPYIKRNDGENDFDDRKTYQTVFASHKGAVAAPTAGLHFSNPLIQKIKAKDVKVVEITLHVGYGTFLPVRATDIRDHAIHSEWFSISDTAAETINSAREKGGRVVAVGTTSVRTLEFCADESGRVYPGAGNCDLYIYPGYRYRTVDAMITNFHLPMSTLLMLVSAFAGRDNILAAYREAIERKYRFFSYGDAMYIA
jgi:S-adenosylmethionine:tRNA ribosyltransferase-isomerase